MSPDKYDTALSVRLPKSIRAALDDYISWVGDVEEVRAPSKNEAIRRLLQEALEDYGFWEDPIKKPKRKGGTE